MDRSIFEKPSAPGQPYLPHVRHSHHSGFGRRVPRRFLLSSPVDLCAGTVRDRMDSPIRWPCLRGQAARIPQRLALSFRRRPLVVGQNQRQSLSALCGAGALARLCLRPFATLFYACLTWGSSSTESMQRLTARFLLLFALVGTFLPLASVATAAPPHACCIRKAAHQCHGALGDGNELTVRSTGCCSHDCCRGVRTSQSAQAQVSLPSIFALHTDICIAQPPANAPTTQLIPSQSPRAPPQIYIA